MHALVPHADAPPKGVESVTVQVAADSSGGLWIEYHVASSRRLALPAAVRPARADGLWNTTCFELFAMPEGGDEYFEFNFSPSFQWAAYAFDGYRTGMRELPCHDPEITVTPRESFPDRNDFWLAVEAMPALPSVPMKVSLSAVIEEADGTKSFWALNHPAGKPDFHHPDCFVLELPPASGA